MPWRLITFLIVLTVLVLFAGFNTTSVPISFGFHTLKNVPLFLSLIIAFLVGAFVMLPFAMRGRKAKGTRKKSRDSSENAEQQPAPAIAEVPVEAEQPPEPPKERSKKKKRSAK